MNSNFHKLLLIFLFLNLFYYFLIAVIIFYIKTKCGYHCYDTQSANNKYISCAYIKCQHNNSNNNHK